jgi:integral membrane protein (TIGR01906 family)
MRASKPASVVLTLALAVLVLSFSISVPILFRPFYYLQIRTLQLPEKTGWSEEIIREAYDDVLDFCVLGKPFSTGALPWSESGRSHFADVRVLFLADFAALAVSGALCVVLLILRWRKRLGFCRLWGRGPCFWAGVLPAVFTLAVAGLASLDFNAAFTYFHAIFFPGKDNWLFDPATDAIILVMPEAFFRNCAILIGVVMIVCCVGLIVWDLRLARPGRKRQLSKQK